ncbi:non-centrosomal microtubule array protein 1-like [Maniola hyperantus]|uniref:non-centrosomal microtubule array protein 1-like n=1 Tax=Aphantopus hyperantus TaxID=2795564 RepID=UPI00156A639F|nr:uncharacterized protein LOC117992904 [Maniola hyperantus]
MGIENMRRWPMYIIFAVSILLTLSLLNSWNVETELQNRLTEVSMQLQECARQQASCREESLRYQEQRDIYSAKVNNLENSRDRMTNNLTEYMSKAMKSEIQINRTLVDVELCKTELQSLKNLQMSKSATLETLRLEKETLTTQLEERKKRIEELEREIIKLKISMTTKSAANPSVSSRVTPAAQPPKLSPALNANMPVIENNAKEEMEDPSALNDVDNFEQQ